MSPNSGAPRLIVPKGAGASPRLPPSRELIEHVRARADEMGYVQETYFFKLSLPGEASRLAIGLFMPDAEGKAEEAASAMARGLRPLCGPEGVDIVCLTEELREAVRASCTPLA